MTKSRFAIIGAGNGGQAFAAHLTLLGHHVSLWDVETQKVEDLRSTGEIVVTGAVEGKATIDLITGDISEAIKGSQLIMVVVPSVYHANVANLMAPYLTEGQLVVLNPGATGGALEVKHIFAQQGCPKVTVAETDTLLYACRSPQAGEVIINGIKEHVEVAAIPAGDVMRVVGLLNQSFPQYAAVENVLVTSLSNTNAMMHPTPTLLNAGRAENRAEFDYYTEGVTPSIAALVEKVDAERLAIAGALGLHLSTVSQWYTMCYGVDGDNLYDKVQKVKAYKGIKGPKNLNTRYLFEDIPTGLVPLSELGKAVGVKTPTIDAVVELGSSLLKREFRKEGRTLQRLGLAGMTAQEICDAII